MRVWCYYALFQRIYSATPNMLALVSHDRDQPATSGATGGLMETPDSGFDEDHGDNDLVARYVDDIYSQSGGVRLRDLQLRPEGEKIYKEFLTVERYAQRAFIWRGLKVENLNFIHDDDKSWLTRKGEPTIITPALLDQPAHPTLQGLTDGGRKHWFHDLLLDFPREDYPHFSLQHVVNLEWNLEHLPIFTNGITEDPRYNDKPGAHAPPPMARPSTDGTADAVTRVAYNDPRYRDSDAVVNYRLNWRDLVKERVDFLPSPSDVDAGDAELMMLLQAGRQIVDRGSDRNFQYDMIVKELQRRGPDTIHIDINVDKILSRRVAPDDIYKYIADAIDMQIERVYQQATSMSPADVTKLLQELADTETATANTYAKFNDPRSHTMARLELNEHALLHDNIDALYQRSNIRREEFHKMTEPVVVRPDAPPGFGRPTYRVHFSDPERRYVNEITKRVVVKSKAWYRALWKRLIEPIFKDAVLAELTETPLRNIVLVYSDIGTDTVVDHKMDESDNKMNESDNEMDESDNKMNESDNEMDESDNKMNESDNEMDESDIDGSVGDLDGSVGDLDGSGAGPTNAYVTADGADIVIHCENLDAHHERADHIIRHEYEHTVDHATKLRTSTRLQKAEIEDDLRTYTVDRLFEEIGDTEEALESVQSADAPAAKTARQQLQERLETLLRESQSVSSPLTQDTFNLHGLNGFVSAYARKNSAETVAEQRYAMRNKAIRIALLRRMALDHPGADADRVKQFYDIARDEMKDVAPQLYAQWGEYYDHVDRPLWGLLPGHTAQVDRHHQIIALDNSLATKMATENLATHFLQRGYDVAIFGKTMGRMFGTMETMKGHVCKLQSNLHEEHKGGSPPRKSMLHLVGRSDLDDDMLAFDVFDYFVEFTPAGRESKSKRITAHFDEVAFVWSP
eukprot:GEMP01005581.1.p1 GENE.GEMP01005581.1~~GEMP01005581.1.p1  ORF type:complete len:924 (+),score=233.14 GEMP01005581.1:32-2773(+)